MQTKTPIVSILGATFGTGNHGVSALAAGTTGAIRRGLPDAKIVILDYDNEPVTWHEATADGVVQVDLINLRFSKKIFLPNNIAKLIFIATLIRLVPVKSWRRNLVRRNAWLSRIAASDLNLSLNGGDSFSDIYGIVRLLYVALPQILLILLERPLIQLPQTYGPFKTASARAIARYLLRNSNLVYSRDHEGLAVVDKLIGPNRNKTRFAYDMGFALEPTKPSGNISESIADLKSKGVLVGFNPSGLLAIGGYSGKNMFGLKTDYWQLTDRILTRLLSEPDCHVILVPHVFGSEENPESDVNACKEVMSRYGTKNPGRIHYFPGYLDHHETKYLIGQCSLFLGSRMHACIGALSQCVPAVGLAYSRKFAGVMELVGDGARVIDLRTADAVETEKLVGEAWDKRDSMQAALQTKIPALRRSILELCQQPEVRALIAS